jgi:hypothetical protein
MGKLHAQLLDHHIDFISRQKMFFTATAPAGSEGHINLSPKGGNDFRVLSNKLVGYMDMTGSGNETSAHLLQNGRITFMFCAFTGAPNILRLYCTGRTILPGSEEWNRFAPHFTLHQGTRQIILAEVHEVQTSCGYGVPFYTYEGERDQMAKWAASKGDDGLEQYRQEKNRLSLDGLPTALF